MTRGAGRSGLALVELVIGLLALALLLVAAAPLVSAWRERPIVGELKAGLRNLAAAQESHYYDTRAYAGDLDALRRTGFAPGPGVQIVIREATRSGWSAEASREGASVRCFIFVRDAAPVGSASTAGTVHCS